MIAGATPAELKGTAFGLFNLASGLFMLLASVIAGGLWESTVRQLRSASERLFRYRPWSW
jgi:hypothetical protein